MYKDKYNKIVFNILFSILNSDNTYDDIISMIEYVLNLRDYVNHLSPSNIQNPRPVGGDTDIIERSIFNECSRQNYRN